MSGVLAAPQWWALALSEEITGSQPHGRRCHDDEIVLFRGRDARVHALENRCAHRRAALSLGRITDDGRIQCGYHGWTYEGESGRCTAIPNLSKGESVLSSYGVRHYVSVERGGFVYVCIGGNQRTQLPSLPFEGMPAQPQYGSLLLTLSHDVFIGALLVGPWVLLSFGDVRIVPNQRMGDPVPINQRIVSEFAAEWLATMQGRVGALPDFSFILRTTVVPITGMASIQLLNEAEEVLLDAQIASQPVHANVTAVRWRYAATPLGAASLKSSAFAMTEHPVPNELMTLSDLGLKAWRDLNTATGVSSATPD
jgi:nitrite reductase/ring-hydroxylating ferredoxin subunit